MEFHVKNTYIKGFLSKFKGQNELKVLKYLTIIGISHLLSQNKELPSFSEIKKIAKTITKNSAKEDKKIKSELRVIKDELSKLNSKFEEKMKAIANKRTEGNLRINTEESYTSGKANFSSPKPNYHDIEKKRNLSTDINRYEKGFSEQKPKQTHEKIHEIIKSRHSITPKPTEISFPMVNPLLNKNTITRHHLDDSQAKALLKEEGICYFPPRKNTSTKEKHTTQASDQPENQQKPQNSRKYPVPKPRTENLKELYDIERETESESEKVLTSSSLVTHEGNKSPQFAKSKEEIIHKIIQETKPETKSYLSPNNKSNNKPNEIEKESSKNKASSKQGSVIEETKKMEKKILREKSRRKNAVGRPANTLNLNDVESKIREKVIRDKYIAKENMRSNDNRQEETIYMHGQKRQEDKFVLVENPNARPNPKSSPLYYKSKYEKPREESKLLESTTSVGQKSINLQNYSGAYTNLTPPQISTSRREAFNMSQRPEDSDRRRYEDHNNENYLGMLDIANSFLNSPLMNQLSGFEKSSGLSLKDSSHQTKNNYSNSRVGTFEVKSSRDRKSPYHSEIEEYNRNQDSMQNRYQEWNSGYRSEYVKSNSNLKESGNNRKYYAEPTKDSRIFNREENSSLASSNFSNFLNEEMRDLFEGFYQKETLEVNLPKYPKEQKTNSGENSSNISFNGNDTSHPDEHTMLGRKSAQTHNLDISKNYASYDKNNVFKQERMSVSRVLNN